MLVAKGCVRLVSKVRTGLESVGRRIEGKKVERQKRPEKEMEE